MVYIIYSKSLQFLNTGLVMRIIADEEAVTILKEMKLKFNNSIFQKAKGFWKSLEPIDCHRMIIVDIYGKKRLHI